MSEPSPPGAGLRAILAQLPPEYKQAALAASGLVVSLFLPWYSQSLPVTVNGRPTTVTDRLNAFGVMSFVEAAILLVAAGVLVLVWTRASGKPFHLPGGDGTVVMAAGGWAAFLLVWRLFDKPDTGASTTVGIQWGWFVALALAGLLALSGARLRAAHRPEPPNPAAAGDTWERPGRREDRRRRRAAGDADVTEVLRERPLWEGEPPDPPPAARRRTEPEPGGEPPRPSASQDRLF